MATNPLIAGATLTGATVSKAVSEAITDTIGNPIDAAISWRTDMQEAGFKAIENGDAAGAVATLGVATAADFLLPLDLVNLGNLLLTGRADEITADKAIAAGGDLLCLLAGIAIPGVGYVAGRGIKAALIVGGTAMQFSSPYFAPEQADTQRDESTTSTLDPINYPTNEPTVSTFSTTQTTPYLEPTPTVSTPDGSGGTLNNALGGTSAGGLGDSTGGSLDIFGSSEPTENTGTINAGSGSGSYSLSTDTYRQSYLVPILAAAAVIIILGFALTKAGGTNGS